MASAQALLSDHNSRVFSQLDALVASYPIDIPQLENLILDLQVDRPEEAKSLVDKTDGIFKHLLMTLLVRKVLVRSVKSIAVPKTGRNDADCLKNAS